MALASLAQSVKHIKSIEVLTWTLVVIRIPVIGSHRVALGRASRTDSEKENS